MKNRKRSDTQNVFSDKNVHTLWMRRCSFMSDRRRPRDCGGETVSGSLPERRVAWERERRPSPLPGSGGTTRPAERGAGQEGGGDRGGSGETGERSTWKRSGTCVSAVAPSGTVLVALGRRTGESGVSGRSLSRRSTWCGGQRLAWPRRCGFQSCAGSSSRSLASSQDPVHQEDSS